MYVCLDVQVYRKKIYIFDYNENRQIQLRLISINTVVFISSYIKCKVIVLNWMEMGALFNLHLFKLQLQRLQSQLLVSILLHLLHIGILAKKQINEFHLSIVQQLNA